MLDENRFLEFFCLKVKLFVIFHPKTSCTNGKASRVAYFPERGLKRARRYIEYRAYYSCASLLPREGFETN
jgi:hypothetical protein